MLKHSLYVLTAGWMLVACQPPSLTPQHPPVNPSDLSLGELAFEYAPFTTQALTQNYLERKINHWLNTRNGTGMV